MDLAEFSQLVEHLRGLWLQSATKEIAELRTQLELAERAKAYPPRNLTQAYPHPDPEPFLLTLTLTLTLTQAYPPDVRAVFERYDRNRNGRLEHAELREALGAFDSKHGRLEVSSREAAAKLAKYD